jgi:hypothetical protein
MKHAHATLLISLASNAAIGAQELSPVSDWDQRDAPPAANENNDRFGDVLASGDFNGDGFDDLAVGSPLENNGNVADGGAVTVFFGSATGLVAAGARVLTEADVEDSTSEPNDRFGWSLAAGDIDNDSFDDLVVGVPFEDLGKIVDTGNVAVIYGSADGLSARSQSVSQTSLPNSSNEAGDRFGWSVAVGDINGDGFGDLVAGVPNEDFPGVTDTGQIGVIFGSADGLTTEGAQPISQASLDDAFNENDDHLGFSVTVGDFNSDGKDDVAVGIPGEDAGGVNDIGMVGVLFGSTGGLQTSGTEIFSQNSLVDATSETGDGFGRSLTAGDFDADGFADLAVGIPLEDIGTRNDAGAIGVFFGSNGGLIPSRSEFLSIDEADETSATGDQFGHSLASGDFDGDGYDDLCAGVPFRNFSTRSDAGSSVAFLGSEDGLVPTRAFFFTASSFGGAEARSDELGTAVAGGDFNNDGRANLVVASPRDNIGNVADAGVVFVGEFADTDGDGLTDVAEGVIGTDPDLADSDADGASDGDEQLAGTDPLDPASRPGIVGVDLDPSNGEITLTWASAPGRTYRVERSSELAEGSWGTVPGADEVPADSGDRTSVTIAAPPGRRFYRVTVLSSGNG